MQSWSKALGLARSDTLVAIFAVLGIAAPFFWFRPVGGELLSMLIAGLGGGFWLWLVVTTGSRWYPRRQWTRGLGSPPIGRMADRQPIEGPLTRWWAGCSPDSRAYFFAFVLVISTTVWQHRTGGELVISDFGAGEVKLYTWRYWGITEKWTEVQFDQESGLWLIKETGRRLICDFTECL